MPAAREWMTSGGVVGVGEVTGGFWIRRVASPAGGVTGFRRLVRTEDNKENIPPPGWAGSTWRRRQRARKSPLPEWYPRTPLRDITAVVQALERRRLRVQAARAAQMNPDSEASPSPTDSTPNPTPESSIISPSPTERALQTSSTLSSFSPTDDHPPQTPSISTDQSPDNLKQTETEKKLSTSIDDIEKVVIKNLKKSAKKEPAAKRAAQRRTLMSMR